MEYNFERKVVLVTGASAGIGEATAILFAKCGAKLALVGRNESNLRKVADICEEQKGIPALIIKADVGTDEGCNLITNKTLEHFGRLDVLVNNAGVGARTCLERADMATYDEVFRVNVRGVYDLTRRLVPALVQSRGNIVNVSSISGTAVSVGSLPYSMAKAALDHFTRLVALELAPKGVRVNTVSPGVTISTFVQRLTHLTDAAYEAWVKEMEKEIPMGEACTGEDIAKMIVHVASDNCRLVTGTTVQVDGGAQFAGQMQGLKKQMNKLNH